MFVIHEMMGMSVLDPARFGVPGPLLWAQQTEGKGMEECV